MIIIIQTISITFVKIISRICDVDYQGGHTGRSEGRGLGTGWSHRQGRG